MSDFTKLTPSKKMVPIGKTPAVALVNPKFPHNVGAAMRAASCWGVEQLWFSGDRVSLDPKHGERLPREERMKGYQSVTLTQSNYFFDQFDASVTPVAIEVREGSQPLPLFEHPTNALYVFGPEDGSIPSVMLRHCHQFVIIPTAHCMNLSAAVYTVLYDRYMKRCALGLENPYEGLNEDRGFIDNDSTPDGIYSKEFP